MLVLSSHIWDVFTFLTLETAAAKYLMPSFGRDSDEFGQTSNLDFGRR